MSTWNSSLDGDVQGTGQDPDHPVEHVDVAYRCCGMPGIRLAIHNDGSTWRQVELTSENARKIGLALIEAAGKA